MLRAIDLATMLFHLQECAGFEFIRKEIMAGQVESAFSVLEAASLLFMNRVPFRFVDPEELPGKIYDLQIHHKGITINAEVKCKILTTEVTENGILSRLTKARRQLPKTMPGVILLRLPTDWLEAYLPPPALEQAVAEFFRRGTSRVISVFLLSHIPVVTGETAQSLTIVKEYKNPKQSHGEVITENLFESAVHPVNWTDLQVLVGQVPAPTFAEIEWLMQPIRKGGAA